MDFIAKRPILEVLVAEGVSPVELLLVGRELSKNDFLLFLAKGKICSFCFLSLQNGKKHIPSIYFYNSNVRCHVGICAAHELMKTVAEDFNSDEEHFRIEKISPLCFLSENGLETNALVRITMIVERKEYFPEHALIDSVHDAENNACYTNDIDPALCPQTYMSNIRDQYKDVPPLDCIEYCDFGTFSSIPLSLLSHVPENARLRIVCYNYAIKMYLNAGFLYKW